MIREPVAEPVRDPVVTRAGGAARRGVPRVTLGSAFRLALWPLGFAWGLGGAIAYARYDATTTALVVSDLLAGWSFMVAGLVAWSRLPDRRVGPIAVATGFAWFVGTWMFSPSPVVHYVAWAFQGWFDPLIAWLALSYPTGRITTRGARIVLAVWMTTLAAWTVARLALDVPIAWYPCPSCGVALDAYAAAQTTLSTVAVAVTLASTVCAAATVVVLVGRLARATPVARRRLAPVALAAILISLGLVIVDADRFLARAVPVTVATPLVNALAVMVAASVLAGLLAEQAARSAVADVVADVQGQPSAASVESLEAALAAAVRDPSLRIVRRGADGRYRDRRGAVVEAGDGPGDPAGVLALDDAVPPGVMLVHDPALLDDPGLASAIRAAVRVHVQNEALQAEVVRQLDEVRASRARLVEAGDLERRRLERDLHDGAQQRLVGLALDIQRALGRLGSDADPQLRAALDDAATDATLAIAELRELARGIHPAALTEGGLGPALDGLAARARHPLEIASGIGEARFPPMIEATAYFVASEGVTNAIKASGASRILVRVQREADSLVVVVADDGSGGADPALGSGLRGLDDRVTAVGGTLTIDSERGAGTRLRAVLPIDG